MSEVKRHSVSGYGRQDICYNDPEGEFVYYEDYAALQQKLNALAAENARVLEDYRDIPEMRRIGAPLTPETDAYLNSVRAEGVEMFGDSNMCPEEMCYAVNEFAAQLRSDTGKGESCE
jgi:hypothetical protein